ncbi:MAG: glucose-6-phosphate isomerase, partial [Hyphomicrobiales bacterium]
MYTQSVDGCLAERIGQSGLTEAELNAVLDKAAGALEFIRSARDDGSLPLLRLPERRDDLDACRTAADRLLDGAKDVVLLGTGGSSLGAQALAQIAGWRDPGTVSGQAQGRPRFHFFDNLDGSSYLNALNTLDLAATRFVAISKSGSTAETMMQTITTLDTVSDRLGADSLPRLFLGLTEPGDNPMRRILGQHGIEMLEHDPKVGGRYSVLSNVGMLPALLLGLDPVAVREGAATVLNPALEGIAPADYAPAIGAAVNVALARKNMNITVLLSYS